ncbi:MAG TPA: alpha-ketoglutarate-dependent dioxygenase AlkB [Chloroflexota bacterium]
MVQSFARQSGLFDELAPDANFDFSRARRIDLDATSWIEHVPGWLRNSGDLFEELMTTVDFEQRDRWMYTQRMVEPRLTAEYPEVGNAPQAMLQQIASALSEHYSATYRSLWINLYRDQRDSTAWHGDVIGKVQEQSTVPVLTLGATRRFLIRPADGGPSRVFRPVSGDLIVMGGRCQRDWRHCVPKQTEPAGPRISINFAPERY